MTPEEAIKVIIQVENNVDEAGFGSLDGLMLQQWLNASIVLRDFTRRVLFSQPGKRDDTETK